MRLAIMQPYFFPYLGYYSLIAASDRFILLDTVQFIRHGWIERNRILKPAEGWQYIAVPLEKHKVTTAIADIAIRDDPDWRSRIARQLEHYRTRAPYYDAAMTVIESGLAVSTRSIVELNASILEATCAYLELPLKLDIYSRMDLAIEKPSHPGDWALRISKALGAGEYLNPAAGRPLFRVEEFDAAGIALRFVTNRLTPYNQRRGAFEPGLSIVDAMMFNSAADVRKLIGQFDIDSAPAGPHVESAPSDVKASH